jgi:dolichol-phosphate mannosyltransferase
VALATLNEIGNVEYLLNEISDLYPTFKILVVDGDSTDGTWEKLKEIENQKESITVVKQNRGMGLASAHLISFIYAIKNKFEILVTMDSDRSHQPKEISKIIDKLQESDVVVGSRYCLGGKSDLSGYRGAISKIANRVAKLIIDRDLSEFTTAFRGFKVHELAKLDLQLLNTRGYSFFFRTVYAAKVAHLRIAEVPIHFKLREQGESKIPKLEILYSFKSMLMICIYRLRRLENSVHLGAESDFCPICDSTYVSRILGRKENGLDSSNQLRCSQETSTGRPTLMKCYLCGHIYSHKNEWPSNTENSYHEVEDSLYLEFESVKRKTFSYVFSHIKSLSVKSPTILENVLEVGSYTGMFLDELKRNSINAIGIEPSRWGYEKCLNKGHKVVNQSFEEYYKKYSPINEFSLVTSWDVLEHVESPREFIRNASIALKKDGYFVFSTLDVENWFPKLMGSRWPWYMPMHLHYFNDRAIQNMLAANKFEFIGKQAYRSYASLRYAGTRLLSSLGFSKSMCEFVGKFIPKVTIPFYFGDVVMYTARKKEN